jgi:invasion protein IalB
MMKRILWSLALVASLGSLSAASAQDADTNVNKVVGDWAVRCFNVKSMAPCDIFYALGTKESKQTIVTISIAYFPSQNKNAINIRVPLGMAIQKGLTIEASAYKSQMISYRRCNQNGCFVEGIVPNDVLEGLKRSGTNATLKITPYGSKDVSLPFSLKGFNQAYSEMVELSKQKASAAPASSGSAAPASGDGASAPAPAAP